MDINNLVSSAVAGRSVTGFAALTWVIIQLVVYLSLFIAPTLREFANVDILVLVIQKRVSGYFNSK